MPTNQSIEIIRSKEAKRRYDFLVNDICIASVDYPKRFAKRAMLKNSNGQWTIARKGWFKHVLEIASDQSPYTKWSLPQNWRAKTTIRTEDNRLFTFQRKNFWKCSWYWVNEKEEKVIEIKSNKWPSKKRGTIMLLNAADMALLFLAQIGWFIVLNEQDDAAVAVAASV